ncbi:MAG: rod shape-determining protein MreC, partial [Alphaproteobacteria bacterium]
MKAWIFERTGSRRMRRLVVGGVLLALALFLLGRFDNPASRAIRERALDLVTPAIAVVEAPLRWGRAGYDWIRDLFALHAENARLKARLRRLEQQLAQAERLAARTRTLSGLLGYRDAPHRLVASGRLVAFDGGAFQESALITVGRRDGVQVGDAVVADAGLVGRILEAGERASRVLLITDLNSRVPVRIGPSGLQAIAGGRNGPRLTLLFLPAGAAPEPGEMVTTSGADGIFPPDLPVGRVVRTAEGELLIEPAVSFARL